MGAAPVCGIRSNKQKLRNFEEFVAELEEEEAEEPVETVAFQRAFSQLMDANEARITAQSLAVATQSIDPGQWQNDAVLGGVMRFLPKEVQRALVAGTITGNAQADSVDQINPTPIFRTFEGAVVFSDASGFTALTESLSSDPNGAELLGIAINKFFGELIKIVIDYGGDIIKFSGDALTIVWPSGPSISMGEAVRRATAACIELHRKLHNFPTGVNNPKTGEVVRLTLHIGVGAGPMSLLQIGGAFDRWEYVLAGEPLKQISIAEPLASSGETVLSGAAIAAIGRDQVVGDACPAPHTDFINVRALTTECPVQPHFLDVPPSIKSADEAAFADRLMKARRFVPAAIWKGFAAEAESMFPNAEDVSQRVGNELRTVSVIFMFCDGLDASKPEGAQKAQLLMQQIQSSVYNLEGTVNKFLIDDKGVLMLNVFGLPPLVHTDDALRAVLCADRMTQALKDNGLNGAVGVATGKVWCGIVGSSLREEFTVMGDTVNLSARLMGLAAKAGGGCVFCDFGTKMSIDRLGIKDIENRLKIEQQEATLLKGKSVKTIPYKISIAAGDAKVQKAIERTDALKKTPLWSFEQHKAISELTVALNSGQLLRTGGAVLISNKAAWGKELMCHKVWNKVASKNSGGQKPIVLYGENSQPGMLLRMPETLGCTKQMCRALMKALIVERAGGKFTEAAVKEKLEELLKDAKNRLLIPELSKLFVDKLFQPATTTSQLHKFFLELLEKASGRYPIVCIIRMVEGSSIFSPEDKADWTVAEFMVRLALGKADDLMEGKKVNPLVTVIACKAGPPPDAYNADRSESNAKLQEIINQVLDDDNQGRAHYLYLHSLKATEVEEYVKCMRGGAGGEDLQKLAAFLHDAAMGDPDMIEKCYQHLLEKFKSDPVVQITKDAISINSDLFENMVGSGDLTKGEGTVPSVACYAVITRVDQLPMREQMVLKGAASLAAKGVKKVSSDHFSESNLGRAGMDEQNLFGFEWSVVERAEEALRRLVGDYGLMKENEDGTFSIRFRIVREVLLANLLDARKNAH